MGTKYDSNSAVVLRKHPAKLLKPLLKVSAPLVISLYILNKNTGFLDVVGLIVLFVGLAYLLYEVIIWYHDIVVITKSQLVEIRQHSLFKREIREIPLESVTNVVIKTTGFLSALFGYGTLAANSSLGELVLADMSKPFMIKSIIEKLQAGSGHSS